MKRLLLFFCLVISGGILSSCTSSPDRISSNDIVKQFNEKIKNEAEQDHFVNLTIGKYELNSDDARMTLRQLEAAGLVTYSVDRYPWWEKTLAHYRKPFTVTHRYWGYDYHETEYRWVTEDRYNFEDHYIVNVFLTKKGKSLVISEMPTAVEVVDKDMVDDSVDPSKYAWNKKDLTETWPTIENPFLRRDEERPAATPEDNPQRPSQPSWDEGTEVVDVTETRDPTVRIDSLKYEAYKALQPMEESVTLKGYSIKAFKARNIQIFQQDGHPVAQAEVLLKTYDTTDAARILEGMENGKKQLVPVTLTYYLDKGWVLCDPDDMDF